MIGERFTKLVVTGYGEPVVYAAGTFKRVVCVCDCGNIITTFPSNLRRGATKSCGCHKKAVGAKHLVTHGLSDTPEYKIWIGVKKRCYNNKYREFHLYGGRGIKMCQSWQTDFSAFLASVGNRPEGGTLDRIDNNGDYEPDNCRWTSPSVQTNNRRVTVKITIHGEDLALSDFALKYNVSYYTAYSWAVRQKLSGEQIERKLLNYL